MKKFFVVGRKDYDNDYEPMQSIKPVFSLERAQSLCDCAARNGNMDEVYAVHQVSNNGIEIIGSPVRGLAEI